MGLPAGTPSVVPAMEAISPSEQMLLHLSPTPSRRLQFLHWGDNMAQMLFYAWQPFSCPKSAAIRCSFRARCPRPRTCLPQSRPQRAVTRCRDCPLGRPEEVSVGERGGSRWWAVGQLLAGRRAGPVGTQGTLPSVACQAQPFLLTAVCCSRDGQESYLRTFYRGD